MAPQDYDVCQCGRVLELQNTDFWLRPTDLSWHFPIPMAISEEPFGNCRSRTSEKWKAKEDKAEEFKKQKMHKNDDGQSCANWQTSSWSWHQPVTWASSSWRQWSSDETHPGDLVWGPPRDGRPSFPHSCHLSCGVLFCCERLSQAVFSHLYNILF